MAVDTEKYLEIVKSLERYDAKLVAVSKIKPVSDIEKLYNLGQRDFGENYVQELVDKESQLPQDIRWHFIGHLQSNKVKFIVPFVHLIHGVDSLKLLTEINKQGKKVAKVINCLLQVHIAQEETKFGMDEEELAATIKDLFENNATYSHIKVVGLMGMASFSDDNNKVRNEMKKLKRLFSQYKNISTTNCDLAVLSMGMSGDYDIALEEGSNMVRIGSLLFGARLQ